MLLLWSPYYVSATCTDNAAWTNLFWYACVCWLLAQNDSRFSAMSLAINWVLKIHIQHRWTCHTICSLRIKKLERKTRETWKYVHVFSRSWRLNSADSTCSFFPLEDVVAISAQDCTTIKQHFTVTMTEQRSFHLIIFVFYKSHGNHCNTSCLQSTLTPQKIVRTFFCNASSNSSATILVQAWISLGSARMRNTDSQIFQSNSILLTLVSVCGPTTTRKILRIARNIRPRRVLFTF